MNGSYLLPVRTASCSTFGDYAIKKKMTVPYSKAKRGDIVLYDFNHNGTSDHTGIIYKVSGGYIYVVEGNTSTSNQCNGGMVMKRTRVKSNVNYIVRPKYDDKITAEMVVETALSQVGVKEYPKNSNKVKYNTWYYGKEVSGSAYPWCMTFVQWVFSHVKEVEKPLNKPTTKYDGVIPNPTLKNGSGGIRVEDLQKFLNWYCKVNLEIDGEFGSKTEEQLKRFQRAEGIDDDGVYGKLSYVKATSYLSAETSDTPEPTEQTIVTPQNIFDGIKKIVDVSYWQHTINWAKVAKDDIQGAILRVSYTSQSSFSMSADSTFVTNLKGTTKNKLATGAYHYSQAISIAEAKKEANFICDKLEGYKNKITLPVVIDWEFGGRLNSSKAKSLGKTKCTEIVSAFCEVVKSKGYVPMVYANYSTFSNYLNVSTLKNAGYLIWLAQYSNKASMDYDVWQYTSSGNVKGISGRVDVNKVSVTTPTKYTGKLPDLVAHSGQKIAYVGKDLAYPKGTAKSKYTYGKGEATPEFTKAINKVYPNRSSWSKQCQAGASCDVGAGTVLRYSGYDKKIPRGLAQQIPYIQKSKIWKKTSLTKTSQMQAGDVGIYLRKSGGGHIWIGIGNGLIVEANHTAKYFLHVDNDNYTNRNKKTWGIYRACVATPISMGDKGTEVVKLQKFLNWLGLDIGEIDGNFGKKTLSAVKLFQEKYNLVVDGVIGEQSIAKMAEIKK